MKKAILLIVSIVSCISLFAQNTEIDIIVTTDEKRIEAKITEVSKSEIRYHEASFIDGPVFVLPTDDINTIIFSNGQVKTYQHSAKTVPAANNIAETKQEVKNESPNFSQIKEVDGHYFLGSEPLRTDELKSILVKSPVAYQEYNNGYSMLVGGIVMESIGLGIELAGLGVMIGELVNRLSVAPGGILCGTGAVCALAIGLPLSLAGHSKINSAIEIYNRNPNYSASIQFQVSQNGVGLALNF